MSILLDFSLCDILYLSCAPYASGKHWEHKCPSAFFVPSFPCKKSESFLLPWDQQGKVLHDHWIVNDPRKYGTTTSKYNDRAGEIDLFATAAISIVCETAKIHLHQFTKKVSHTLV